nr:G5 domain-containing protein [Candidatus Moranbacteria bacterium]
GVKTVVLNDDGLAGELRDVEGNTIQEVLEKSGIHLRAEDSVRPELSARAISGQTIFITRAREVSVNIDGGEKKFISQERTVGEMLSSGDIDLNDDDIVKPDRKVLLTEGLKITVTRVEIREEIKEAPIAFETKTTEDDELSWRKKITTQKGEKGIKATTYRVAYHDGKEVNRKIMKTEVMKEPVAEVVTQGTFVKLGKKHEGGASWYAWTGTMAAANPWLPKGSYVKVTNLENGKSVIVVINDRGPFVGGRIIDLDKVAFAKIASIGAGVINVKMEEISN